MTLTKTAMQELAVSERDEAFIAVRRRIGKNGLFTGEQFSGGDGYRGRIRHDAPGGLQVLGQASAAGRGDVGEAVSDAADDDDIR